MDVLKVNLELQLWCFLELTNIFSSEIFDYFRLSLSNFSFNPSFIFGIKFLLTIMFLILIRGGTPRYRYDYLTKLGWLKFVGLTITILIASLVIFIIL